MFYLDSNYISLTEVHLSIDLRWIETCKRGRDFSFLALGLYVPLMEAGLESHHHFKHFLYLSLETELSIWLVCETVRVLGELLSTEGRRETKMDTWFSLLILLFDYLPIFFISKANLHYTSSQYFVVSCFFNLFILLKVFSCFVKDFCRALAIHSF